MESRYRRLLSWYPRDHRERHEDEMVDVLLQSAAHGQSKPAARDTFDLLLAGLWLHLRRAFGSGSTESWRSAMGVVGALGSTLLLVNAVIGMAGTLVVGAGLVWESAVSIVLVTLTVAMGWANKRWLAAGAGWGYLAMTLIGAVHYPMFGGGSALAWMVTHSVELYLAIGTVIALTLTARPRAGHVWVWHRRPFLLAGSFAVAIVLASPPLWLDLPLVDARLPLAIVASVGLGGALRTSLGGRVAALLAVPYLVFVVNAADQALMQKGLLPGAILVLASSGVLVTLLSRAVAERKMAPRVPA